jgi:hypothetical protein
MRAETLVDPHEKCSLTLLEFESKLKWPDKCNKIPIDQISYKSVQWFSSCSKRTDRPGKANGLISAYFRYERTKNYLPKVNGILVPALS